MEAAERLAEGVDPNKLVVVPYANPFRTYPLSNDYEKFKKLVAEKNVGTTTNLFGSTPSARRSAEDLFVASVAPITDAKEAPFNLTTEKLV